MSRVHYSLSLWVCLLSPLSVAADELPSRAVARLGDYRFYHGPNVTCVALSPDGRCAASAERSIILWDATTGERLRELPVFGPKPVCCVAFSPDGKRLAAGTAYDYDRQRAAVAVYEVETGNVLWRRGEWKNDLCRAEFSVDGKKLYVSERGGAVSAWDAASGTKLRVWQPFQPAHPKKGTFEENVAEGILSPDGKIIVWRMTTEEANVHPYLHANILRVCDAQTEQELYCKEAGKKGVIESFGSLAFSSDGKRFAAVWPRLTIWEAATGKEVAVFHAPSTDEEPVAFTPTSDLRRAVIRQNNSRMRLWDLESGKALADLCSDLCQESQRTGQREAFSADGKTVLVATEGKLRLWDTATGRERLATAGPRAGVCALAFSPDGRALLTSCLETTCRWDTRTGQETSRLTARLDPTLRSGILGFSLDRRYYLDQQRNDCVIVRDTVTRRKRHELAVKCEDIVRNLFAPDGDKVLLFDLDSERMTCWLYDVTTGKKLAELVMPGYDQTSPPMFSGDGRFVAFADEEHAVHVYNAATGKAVRTLQSRRPLDASPCCALLAFSWDGDYLAIASELHVQKQARPPLVRVFQVSSGQEISHFALGPTEEDRADRPLAMALSPDGRLLAVAEPKTATIRLFEVASGKQRGQLIGHRAEVWSLAFAPDGDTLASGGSDTVVFLWDLTGARTRRRPEKSGETEVAAWWSELAREDAVRAGDAQSALIQAPQVSVAFLAERLRPTAALDKKRVACLIADLDADAFPTREAASAELARLAGRVEEALRQALTNKPSPEAKRRIEELLEKLDGHLLSSEELREIRAVEALEHIGTPDARKLLNTLAKGAPEVRLTREAKAALKRLQK